MDDLTDIEDSIDAHWRIESIGSADWAMLRMVELEEERRSIISQREAAAALIEARSQKILGRIERVLAFFRAKLLEYAEGHKAELLGHGRGKSRALLHGRIGWRTRGGRIKITDAAALETWLLAQPPEAGLYRIRAEPEMRALQKALDLDGIVPPGCDVEPTTEQAYVTTASETLAPKGG